MTSTQPRLVSPDTRPRFEQTLGQPEPRLRLVVSHEGHVALQTCDDCTGTPELIIEVLEEVLRKLREGVIF